MANLAIAVGLIGVQLDPASARRVAAMLTAKANEAEARVIAPSFDSVPPTKA